MSNSSPLIRWRDDFEIGIPEVDYEHRALIDAINAWYERVHEGAVDIEGMLGEILSRTSAHFALEEKDMAAMGWAELAEHKADHERLLDQLRDIMEGLDVSPEVDPEALGGRMSAWFTRHFASFDARLHRA